MILAQTDFKIYDSEAVRGGIFDRFLNFNNCQLELVSDVISGPAVQDVGMDVCANLGDSRLKPLEASWVIFGCFSNVDNFRPEVDSDIVSGVFKTRPV